MRWRAIFKAHTQLRETNASLLASSANRAGTDAQLNNISTGLNHNSRDLWRHYIAGDNDLVREGHSIVFDSFDEVQLIAIPYLEANKFDRRHLL